MTRDEAFAALLQLTHGWRPTGSSSPPDLQLARRVLAAALLRGQHEPFVLDGGPPAPAVVDPGVTAGLALALDEAAAGLARLGASLPPRVFVRPCPIATHHDIASMADWAAGRARDATHGPFVDDLGREWWVDTYVDDLPFITFAREAHGAPLLLIPDESAFRSEERVELAAGTVWIAAGLFSSKAPAGFVGFRINGGTLSLDGPTHGSNPILLHPQGSITLELDLVAPVETGPAGNGCTLPAQATIRVSPGGIDLVESDDLSIELDGSTHTLHRNPEPPRFEPALRSVYIPYAVEAETFVPNGPPSSLYTLDGDGEIEDGGWTIPVTHAGHFELGDASGIGAAALTVTGGLTASWRGLDGGPIRFRRTLAEVSPGLVTIVSPAAETRRHTASIALWDEMSTPRRSSLNVRFQKPSPLVLLRSTLGVEQIVATASVMTHVDRPLYASGRRPGVTRPDTSVRWLQDGNGRRVQIVAPSRPVSSTVMLRPQVMSLAISNALLRTSPIDALFMSGRLAEDAGVSAGALVFVYQLHDVLPILPDPYAANVDIRTSSSRAVTTAGLLARVQWASPSTPQLTLAAAAPRDIGERLSDLLPMPLPATSPRSDESLTAGLYELFDRSVGSLAAGAVRLLDLSSHADQLGVALTLSAGTTRVLRAPEVTIQDLHLATPGVNVRVLMQPQVQWEPVITPQPSPDPAFPGTLYSVDDGGPGLIGANTVRLVPIAPVPVAEEIVHALESGEVSGAALFTLPFGIKAVATMPGRRLPGTTHASTLRLRRPTFGALTGGRHFRLAATFVPNDGRSIPGAAVQLSNASAGGASVRMSVLDSAKAGPGFSTGAQFNATFKPGGTAEGVPISAIDLSGYGESGVSLWTYENPQAGAAIVEVRFDVLNGRTAYEVVQEMSVCWPSEAIFVRTITMERKGDARVIRSDSGWTEAAPGTFRLPGFDGVFHPGAIKGYHNITQIREVGALVEPLPGVIFQPVLFNADVAVEHVTLGQRTTTLDANGEPAAFVPVTDVVGYVQRAPQTMLTHAQLAALFKSQGPIGSAMDCEIDVGGSGLRMRVTGAYAEAVGGNTFAVAARGMPILPHGQWSVTRTDNAFNGAEDHEPQPVERTAAVPLIREGPATLKNALNANPYRFADPADLLSASPAFDYSLLFATEVFRLLFVRPRLDVDANHVGRRQVSSFVRPLLADPYAVVSTSAIFPRAKHCLRFPTTPSLDILPGNHLRLPPVAFKVEPFLSKEQAKTSNWKMTLEYADETGRLTEVKVTLDTTATPPATLVMSPMSTVLDTGPFTGLMRIVGDLEARSPATVVNPSVVFGSVLAPVGDIMTILRDLSLPFAMAASIAGADDKALIFRQTIHINIAKILKEVFHFDVGAEDDVIETGFGKIKGDIEVGIFISLSGKTHAGVLCKIIGELQQKILPLGQTGLYAGGHLAFEIAFEIEEEKDEQTGQKAIKEQSKIELTAAVVGSVGGDLIKVPAPGGFITLLEGEATIRKGYVMEIDLVTEKIKPGVMIGMEVEAGVVELVEVGFEWEGKGLITRHGDKLHVKAEVAVAVSVTLAIFLEITIEIEGEYEIALDEKVVAGLLIAFGIIPV